MTRGETPGLFSQRKNMGAHRGQVYEKTAYKLASETLSESNPTDPGSWTSNLHN
jgi:hypothetical protein